MFPCITVLQSKDKASLLYPSESDLTVCNFRSGIHTMVNIGNHETWTQGQVFQNALNLCVLNIQTWNIDCFHKIMMLINQKYETLEVAD